jgi:exopolyphosphatase/pppGpp-phosphohydrolase
MIRELAPPLGWSPGHLVMLASVVRFHRGALPHAWHKSLRGLAPEQRQISKLLADILRFADALDNTHDAHVRRLQLEDKNGFLLISAAGFKDLWGGVRSGDPDSKLQHLRFDQPFEVLVR